jgi:hypothetical protein
MATRGQKTWWWPALAAAVAAAVAGGPAARAWAQAADAGPEPDAGAPDAAAPPAAILDEPSAPDGGVPTTDAQPAAPPVPATTAPPPEPAPTVFVPAAPEAPAARHHRGKRTKPLQTTVGLVPTAPDFGSEADLVSSADDQGAGSRPRRWTYSLKGFLRAPMRVGFGPLVDGTPGHQAHSPPRIAGGSPDDWYYAGLAPPPTASLYLTVGNASVAGTMIIAASTLYDAGYKDLVNMGGFSQAYVTMKAPDLFAGRGGLAWTVGSFSNRYGTAGPADESSGYYGTYLFGRTHVAGEALTADFDVSDRVELVVEHGLGAKLEVVPWVSPAHVPPAPQAPYLPDQGPVPQGSNYVHHVHAQAIVDGWLRVAGHYVTSWSPNDLTTSPAGTPVPEARLTITGGEVHADSRRFGSGYVGYSHVAASHVLPLADGVQVIHGTTGYVFKNDYFGALNLQSLMPLNDSGTVDTVLFQYLVRAAPALGLAGGGRDLAVAVYGMINHIRFPDMASGATIRQDRLKFGVEAEAAPSRYIWVGARFDRVQGDGGNGALAYSAISPRVIVHTSWLSREYFLLDYSHFILGSRVPTSTVYNAYGVTPAPVYQPDTDMVMLSALLSF